MAGLAITAATMSWTAGSWVQERLAVRWTSRRFVSAGLFILLAGIGGLIAGLACASICLGTSGPTERGEQKRGGEEMGDEREDEEA